MTGNIEFKGQQGRFRLHVRKVLLSVRIGKHWEAGENCSQRLPAQPIREAFPKKVHIKPLMFEGSPQD